MEVSVCSSMLECQVLELDQNLILIDNYVPSIQSIPILSSYYLLTYFPMGLGRNYRTPPASILTYSSRLVHIHTSDHTCTPFAISTHLTFLKDLTNIHLFFSHYFRSEIQEDSLTQSPGLHLVSSLGDFSGDCC